MNVKAVFVFFLTLALLILGGYVLLEHGGKIKFGNLMEIESNKNKAGASTTEVPITSSNDSQNATVSGSGTAINANNGASVSIGR